MAENTPVTEEKIKDRMFWAALYTLYYTVEEREKIANEQKANDMKRITLHLAACTLFAPCLLAFTSGCLLANAAGTLYAGCLVYMSGHTAKGRKFTRKYYKEVLCLEKLLQTNS